MWRSLWQTHSWPLFCQAKWEGGQWMPFCILELLLERLVNSDLNRKWKNLSTETSYRAVTSALRHLPCVVFRQRFSCQLTEKCSDDKKPTTSGGLLRRILQLGNSTGILSSLPSSLWNSSAKCVVENCHQCLQGCHGKRWERKLKWESPVGWWISTWRSPITETVQGQAWDLSQVV